jgi:hypothetical protein
MGDKLLNTNDRLSWIKDTTATAAAAPKPETPKTIGRTVREPVTPQRHVIGEAAQHRFEQDVDQPPKQAPAGGPEQAFFAAVKKPPTVHYWLSVIALICVAFTVPDRFATITFLGFIFVILMEISYRLAQQYLLNKETAENINTLLKALNKTERDRT